MKKLLPDLMPRGLATLILSLSMLPPAAAEPANQVNEKWYQLEIVAFTTAKPAEVQEQWLQAPVILTEESLSLEPLATEPVNIEPPILPEGVLELDKEAFLLTKQAYTLSRQRGYDVVAHQSFAIKGMDKETAPWLELLSESPSLNGKIRLHLSQYLHTNFDFKIHNPDWSPNPSLQHDAIGTPVLETAEWIDFKTSRRMKIGELHYIDHPLAGVLAKIERYEPVAEPVTPAPAGQ